MARRSPWPTVVGTATLIALPVLAAAQTGQATGSTGSQASQTPTAQSDTKYPSTAGAATQHLTEAKQVLDGIPRNAVTGSNAAKINQIRREFAALERTYKANPSPSASETSPSASKRTKATAGDWNTHLMALDRDLTALLGPESASGSTETSATGSTSTGTTGTSGSASSATSSSLDPSVKSQLEEFRKHITAFASAASGTQPGGEMSSESSSSSTMSSTTGTSASTSSTSPTEPTSPTSPTTSGTSSSSTQTGSAAGETTQSQSMQTTGASDAQVDASVAREHLTQARQSLADLTALPQAQQLQGEARTQVSQLISQFNQLITTQDDWRAAYDQVNTTLTSLLSGSSTSSSSTQGAVGTSGSASASGSASLDPAIRTKLEEFKTHLAAFYSAAGGDATTPASGSTSSMTSSGTTSSTSGTSTGYTGSTAGSTASSAEVESHIDAIEQILDQASGNSTGATAGTAGSTTGTATGSTSSSSGSTTGSTTSSTSGSTTPSATSGSSVTLTPQQLAQIRMHLQQLRTAIKK